MAKGIKKKFKGIKKNKYIKDKALIHFIHQHSIEEKIDFSKIKIPSFSNLSETDKDDFKEIKSKYLNKNSHNPYIYKNQKNNKMPGFGLSLLNFFVRDDNSQKTPKFESFIFK